MVRVGARVGLAAMLVGMSLAMVAPGASAAAAGAPGEDTGTHTGESGGVTVDVSPDGLTVYAMKLQQVPGNTLHGTCSADYTINRTLPLVDGVFGFHDDFIAVQGTFSPKEPGVLSGAFEIHATGYASPYGVECNVNTRLEYSAKLRTDGGAAAVPPPAVAAPAPATPTPAPATPTPPPTTIPTLPPARPPGRRAPRAAAGGRGTRRGCPRGRPRHPRPRRWCRVCLTGVHPGLQFAEGRARTRDGRRPRVRTPGPHHRRHPAAHQ